VYKLLANEESFSEIEMRKICFPFNVDKLSRIGTKTEN